MKKVFLDGEEIYINDSPIDIKETDAVIPQENMGNNKEELNNITKAEDKDLFEDTLTDIWSDADE